MAVHCFLMLLFLCICYYNARCNAIESPQYTVVRSASNLEIRLYKESSWISAFVHTSGDTSSFNTSTKEGFHRLYLFMHGGNANSSRIPITAPILTTINQSAHGTEYAVRFYLASKLFPLPNTQLNLQFDSWKPRCIAVRKFPGFAKDENIKKEKEALMSSLSEMDNGKLAAVFGDKGSFSVAQYNASFHLTGRLNEIWISLSGLFGTSCPT